MVAMGLVSGRLIVVQVLIMQIVRVRVIVKIVRYMAANKSHGPVVLAAMTLVCACHPVRELEGVISYTPLTDTETIADLSPYISDVEAIPLEDTLLTGGVYKALLVGEDSLAILDYGGSILLADGVERRTTRILHKGRAANEYIDAADIAYNGSELMVLEESEVKFVNVSDGKLSRVFEIPVHLPFDAMAPCGKDGAYLFAAFPLKAADAGKEKDNLLLKVDFADGTVEEFIPREDVTFSMDNICQSSGNRYYLRPQNCGHVFYRLDEEGPVAELRVDFEDANIPDRHYFKDSGNVPGFMRSAYYKLPMGLAQNDGLIYFRACGPYASEENYLYLTNRETGIHWTSLPLDAGAKIVTAGEDCIYGIFMPSASADGEFGPLYELMSSASGNPSGGVFMVKLTI